MSQGICADCGTYRWIERHHIVRLKDGGTNEPENVVGLCANCHQDRHGGPMGGEKYASLNFQSPESKAKRKESRRRKWENDAEYRARITANLVSVQALAHTPEVQSRRAATRKANPRDGEKMKKLWADPEWRNRVQASMKGLKRSEETRQRISAAKKNQTVSEETRARMSETHQARWADPAWRASRAAGIAKQSETMKARWADPAWRAKRLKK